MELENHALAKIPSVTSFECNVIDVAVNRTFSWGALDNMSPKSCFKQGLPNEKEPAACLTAVPKTLSIFGWKNGFINMSRGFKILPLININSGKFQGRRRRTQIRHVVAQMENGE